MVLRTVRSDTPEEVTDIPLKSVELDEFLSADQMPGRAACGEGEAQPGGGKRRRGLMWVR